MSWDAAAMALIGSSAAGFVLADGERARIKYMRAMRRCLISMADRIRYEEPTLRDLLHTMDLRATQQERQLTRLLRECAVEMQASSAPILLSVYQKKAKRIAGYGALTQEDKEAFETALADLGRIGKQEQLHLLDCAEARLARQEAAETEACGKRAKLISALGVMGGAALFLLLV